MPALIVSHGRATAGTFEWACGSISIGRAPSNDIDLSSLDDRSISRSHAKIELLDDGYEIRDVGAKNAIFVNGKLVSRHKLAAGDEIRIGDVRLVFSLAPPQGLEQEQADASPRGATTASPSSDLIRTLRAPFDASAVDVEVLRRSHQRLLLLFEVVREFHAARSVRELLHSVVRAISRVTPAVRVFAALFRRGTHEVAAVACHNIIVPERPDRWPVSSTLIRRVVEQGQAILTDNATSDPQFRGVQSVQELQIRSVLCSPLLRAGEPAGLIYADNLMESGAFDAQDLDLVRLLAFHAGAALLAAEAGEKLSAENARLQRENLLLAQPPPHGSIVGHSEAVRALLERAQDIAAIPREARLSLMVTGETGTGKELLARHVHATSARSDGPFVAVNCAAIPENLVEAELFGIEAGVATGVAARQGKFELADGGIIFLDEVGDMSLMAQAKVLRALDDNSVVPVGGGEPRPVDVWTIAATHKDLAAGVAAGWFREDLLYRLRSLELHLPPLRQRERDVRELATFFLDKYCREFAKPAIELEPDALEAIAACPWPGNVRELENCIAGCVAFCRRPTLATADLPPHVRAPAEPHTQDLMSLEEMEKQHLQRVMEHTQGNITRAASILGIGRQAVYHKLARYHIRHEAAGR